MTPDQRRRKHGNEAPVLPPAQHTLFPPSTSCSLSPPSPLSSLPPPPLQLTGLRSNVLQVEGEGDEHAVALQVGTALLEGGGTLL